MSGRLLAEVEVFGPSQCQVFPHADSEWTATSISRSAAGSDNGTIVEEFTLVGDDESVPAGTDRANLQRIFSSDQQHIYRLTRNGQQGCVCERIEGAGCVVHEFRATAKSLLVTFLTPDVATLRRIVDDLQENADCLKLRRLLEDDGEIDSTRPIVFDSGKLTSRQREVLEVAYDRGYFRHPREATAGDVASELGIATSTFTEHLAAAQRKLLEDLLRSA